VHLVVELLLQPAQSGVVGAHIAQHLRGQIVVGIKTLELFLEVDALQVQLAYPVCRVRIDPPRHPRKALRVVEARQNLLLRGEVVRGFGMHHLGQHLRRRRAVLAHLRRHSEDRIDRHRHGQLAQVAVVQHTALRGHLEGALLLVLCLVDPLRVLDHL
jgi:hypothetical protein